VGKRESVAKALVVVVVAESWPEDKQQAKTESKSQAEPTEIYPPRFPFLKIRRKNGCEILKIQNLD